MCLTKNKYKEKQMVIKFQISQNCQKMKMNEGWGV